MNVTTCVVSRNLLFRSLMQLASKRGKRLLLLSSFIAFVYKQHQPEREFVRNMNDVLKLSENGERAMEIPIRVSRLIWNGTTLLQQEIEYLKGTNMEQKRQAAQRIAAMIPQWMAYGSVDEISRDLMVFFSTPTQSALMAA